MSTGIGISVVQPVIATHAILGAAQTAAVAAAGVVAVAAVTAGIGAGTGWAVAQALRAGAARAGRAADRCEQALAEVQAYEQVVGAVAGRNAELGGLLGELARAGRAASGVPDLMVLGNQTPAELEFWCREVDAELPRLRRDLAEVREAALNDRWQSVVAGELGQVQARALVEAAARAVSDPAPLAPVDERAVLAARVRELLAQAPARIATADVEALARAGGAVLTAPAWERPVRLKDLIARLQNAQDTFERRRAEAREAAVLVQPLLPSGPDAAPGTAAVREELLDVISGSRGLDDDLRRRAMRAIDALVREAGHQYLGTTVKAEMEALAGEQETMTVLRAHDGRIGVRLAAEPDHELRLAVRSAASGGDDSLTWQTVRVAEPVSVLVPDPARDEAACEQACAVMDRLTARLERQGVERRERTRQGPGGSVPLLPPLVPAGRPDEAGKPEAAQEADEAEAREEAARHDRERLERAARQATARVRRQDRR